MCLLFSIGSPHVIAVVGNEHCVRDAVQKSEFVDKAAVLLAQAHFVIELNGPRRDALTFERELLHMLRDKRVRGALVFCILYMQHEDIRALEIFLREIRRALRQ